MKSKVYGHNTLIRHTHYKHINLQVISWWKMFNVFNVWL